MADDLNPITRAEMFMSGNEAELTPITREEVILSGGDLTPVTRKEWFLKKYRGGGGGNQNTQQTVTGTAANPWGNVSYSELAAALASGDAHAVINVQMGETVGRLFLISNEGLVIYAGNAVIRSSLSDSDCATFSWGANGSIIYVHAISGGQYQDYTAYAAGMQTSLTIYWHPMP